MCEYCENKKPLTPIGKHSGTYYDIKNGRLRLMQGDDVLTEEVIHHCPMCHKDFVTVNGCRYCKATAYDDLVEEHFFGKYFFSFLSNGKFKTLWDFDYMDYEVEIMRCPMCGRKL